MGNYNDNNRVYRVPRHKIDSFGRVTVSASTPEDYAHLMGLNVNDIVLFDNGTDEMLDQGIIILPRQHILFVGTKDGELQYKSYEFNPYRIVVTTYKDIIYSIDSIG